jgi:DNA-binding MarR family transcriptional regulator
MAEPAFDIGAALKRRLPDADQDLALLIIATTRLGRILKQDLQQMARSGGLEESEYSVITILWLAGPDHPLSPTQLSQIIIQTTSGMTKTLRRLEEAALVERFPDPADGRRQLIRLTSAGSHLIDGHTRQMYARWDERLRQYDRAERARLATTLWSFVTLAEESFLGQAALERANPGGGLGSGPARGPA